MCEGVCASEGVCVCVCVRVCVCVCVCVCMCRCKCQNDAILFYYEFSIEIKNYVYIAYRILFYWCSHNATVKYLLNSRNAEIHIAQSIYNGHNTSRVI